MLRGLSRHRKQLFLSLAMTEATPHDVSTEVGWNHRLKGVGGRGGAVWFIVLEFHVFYTRVWWEEQSVLDASRSVRIWLCTWILYKHYIQPPSRCCGLTKIRKT